MIIKENYGVVIRNVGVMFGKMSVKVGEYLNAFIHIHIDTNQKYCI